MKINKSELVTALFEEGGLLRKDAEIAVDFLFDFIKLALRQGNEVNISNFGSFIPMTKIARAGTSPSSHEAITIPETKSVSFHLAKSFKEALNK
ncbi:MAG: HU family DNA-binding protein [Coprobacillus sp.]|nr:HU family DNA-binding protein [Coprobacillus sp.]